jgi:hypothetical protein
VTTGPPCCDWRWRRVGGRSAARRKTQGGCWAAVGRRSAVVRSLGAGLEAGTLANQWEHIRINIDMTLENQCNYT